MKTLRLTTVVCQLIPVKAQLVEKLGYKESKLVDCKGVDKIGDMSCITKVYIPALPDFNFEFTGLVYFGSRQNVLNKLTQLFKQVNLPLPTLLEGDVPLPEVTLQEIAISLGINPNNAEVLKNANSKLKAA